MSAKTIIKKSLVETYSIKGGLGLFSQISVRIEPYEHSRNLFVALVITGDHINGMHCFVTNDVQDFFKKIKKEYTLLKFVRNEELYEFDKPKSIKPKYDAFWEHIWLPFVEAYSPQEINLCKYKRGSTTLLITGCDKRFVDPDYLSAWDFCPACGGRISVGGAR